MLIKPSIFAVIAASALLASQDAGKSVQDYRTPSPDEHSMSEELVVDGHHPPHYELIYRGDWPDRIRHEIRCYDNLYVIHYRRFPFDGEGSPLISMTVNGDAITTPISEFEKFWTIAKISARCNGKGRSDEIYFTTANEEGAWFVFQTFDQGKLVRSTMRKRDD